MKTCLLFMRRNPSMAASSILIFCKGIQQPTTWNRHRRGPHVTGDQYDHNTFVNVANCFYLAQVACVYYTVPMRNKTKYVGITY